MRLAPVLGDRVLEAVDPAILWLILTCSKLQ